MRTILFYLTIYCLISLQYTYTTGKHEYKVDLRHNIINFKLMKNKRFIQTVQSRVKFISRNRARIK